MYSRPIALSPGPSLSVPLSGFSPSDRKATLPVAGVFPSLKRLPSVLERRMINPRSDKLIKRITIVATAAASYFLLTADYGPEPNALDPIKNAILSAECGIKDFVLGSGDKPGESQLGNMGSSSSTKKQN